MSSFHQPIAAGAQPVILLHCSSGAGLAWGPVAAPLAPDFRVFAPDLLGYGAKPAWPRGARLEPGAEWAALEPLFDQIKGPVHLVGHSYGGAVALDIALNAPQRLASLTLIEPVAFPYLRAAGDQAAWETIAEVARRCQALVAEGRDAAAAEIFVGYWMGKAAWAMTPEKARAAVIRSMPKVAAEWGLMFEAKADLEALAALDPPVTLIVGERTRTPARAVSAVLARTLPHATVHTIAGAGHMSALTHRGADPAKHDGATAGGGVRVRGRRAAAPCSRQAGSATPAI